MSGDNPSDRRWRQGVGGIVFNTQGKVWMGQRCGKLADDAWQFPQGGLEKGEAAADGLMRELGEEIGTDLITLVGEPSAPMRYRFPPELARRLWGGRYLGQEQLWFLCRFTGDDSAFRLDASPKPEFRSWDWFAFEAAPDKAVPFKRGLYEALYAHFSPQLRAAREG